MRLKSALRPLADQVGQEMDGMASSPKEFEKSEALSQAGKFSDVGCVIGLA